MDLQTLSSLHNIFQEVQQKPDWKAALDTLFVSLRDSFIFDNVAIYLKDQRTRGLDVVYARAVGRGKTAEADVVWGESLASEVIAKGQMILKVPTRGTGKTGRLDLAHLLAFPLYIGSKLGGALVFVRFGGPAYSELHIQTAALQAFWTAALIERRDLQQARTELDSVQLTQLLDSTEYLFNTAEETLQEIKVPEEGIAAPITRLNSAISYTMIVLNEQRIALYGYIRTWR